MDSDPETIEWIRNGYIQGTIAQRPYTMGFVGLQMLNDLHRHRPPPLNVDWATVPFPPVPSFVNTGVICTDRQNVTTSANAIPPLKIRPPASVAPFLHCSAAH